MFNPLNTIKITLCPVKNIVWGVHTFLILRLINGVFCSQWLRISRGVASRLIEDSRGAIAS